MDIQKAYDSISWDFVEEVLLAYRFPSHFIKLVMNGVRSSMFSVMINGQMEGYFQGKRGLRQGDPISPLLFVLCMDYFTRIMDKMTSSGFTFHKKCKVMGLSHLCFADDLFVFANGDLESIKIIKAALFHFHRVSGLQPNLQKCTIFFNGVDDCVKREIMTILNFKEGFLPVRYLGLPLISTKLSKSHC